MNGGASSPGRNPGGRGAADPHPRGSKMKWQAYHTHQEGDTDCGPACVRTVLRRHGIHVDSAILRESVGLGEGGASLFRLQQVLDDYGVTSQAFRLTVDELHQAVTLAGPTIALTTDAGLSHFVVVQEALPNGDFVISDPWFHRPRTVTADELSQTFSGETLVSETPSADVSRWGRFRHSWKQSVFVNEMRENRRTITGVIALTLLVAALSISSSIYLQVSVDRFLQSDSISALTLTSLSFVGMVLAAGALQYIRGLIIVRFGQRVQKNLSERYVEKLLRLPVRFYSGRRTGDLASRLDDIQGIQTLLTSTTIGVSVDIAVVLIIGGYLAWASLPLFGILMSSAFITVVASWTLYRGIRETSEEALQRDATLKSELINILDHHEVVISHGKRAFAARRISETLSRRIQSETRLGRLDNLSATIRLVTHGCFAVTVTWIGLLQAQSGRISLGQVLSFISLSGYFLTSLVNISTLQTTLQRSSAAIGRYRDIMTQREPAIVPSSAGAPARPGDVPAQTDLSHRAGSSLSARGLTFSYPGTARRVIEDVSVSVPAGRSVHLAGDNASGKSTLLKLLAGLHTADAGTVFVGDVPLERLDPETVPHKVLYLPEIPMIVNATVRENLTLGAHHSQDEIDQACALAHATSVVDSLDKGYDEVLREDGTRLSRGQLQKLALARAVLIRPDVFLFDESFSGIDQDSFVRIWDSLATTGATRVLVAHREVDDLRCDLTVRLDSAPDRAALTKEPA
ncbi:peptidase domain-containing ABC transporter [Streptomyces sp. NPDC056943]|uniref:peptidase domain-containing ABC transporter n=1 Tax=Streptomyces sp. NPDC056943 TaxID=3345971 RepID=UPI00362F7E2F